MYGNTVEQMFSFFHLSRGLSISFPTLPFRKVVVNTLLLFNCLWPPEFIHLDVLP